MIATIIISSVTFVLVALSILFLPTIKICKFNLSTYWIVALVGAFVLLMANLAPIKLVFNQLTANTAVNPIKIIVLFFSMTVLSIYLDEVGLFRYLANAAIKKAGNNQFALFTVLYFLVAVLTIFTSNDIVILTFTPFICFFCKNAKINPIPYLVAEFTAANTWSLMLLIGNPTNIYLATSANIGFFEYVKVMAVPTIVCGFAEYALLVLLFSKKLKEPLDTHVEDYHIENKVSLFVGLGHLLTCLLFLIISGYIHVEMWLVSFVCACSLLTFALIMSLVTKKDWHHLTGSLKKLPYQLIPFFLSMFVIVVALNYQGISANLAKFLGNSHIVWTYGYSSFIACNLINNIPMSILYSNICSNRLATFASIIGSNIGAFLTPIGALAGIMFTNLVNTHDVKYSFFDFAKYGAIISFPVITIALGMLILAR